MNWPRCFYPSEGDLGLGGVGNLFGEIIIETIPHNQDPINFIGPGYRRAKDLMANP